MGHLRRASAAVLVLLAATVPAAADARYGDVVQFGTGPGNERVSDMVRDADGNTYVVGYTLGSFQGFTNEGEVDGYVAKIGPTGTVLWADQFGGADDNGENGFYSVALDGAGGVYVAGVTQQALHRTVQGYSDVVVRRYNPDGSLVWGDQFHGTTGGDGFDAAFGIATSGSAVHVVGHVSGRGFLRTYTTSGVVTLHTEEVDTDLWDVATADDDVYVLGARRLPDGGQGFVRRIAPTGTTEARFAAWGEPMHLAVNERSVAASGTTWSEGQDTVISAWDRALQPRWTSTGNVDPTCWCGQPVWDLALAPTGDVFAVGGADHPDGFVRKHAAATGHPIWEVQLEAAGWGIGGVVVEGEQMVFSGASTTEMATDGVGAFVASWPTVRTVPLTRLAGRDRVGTALAVARAAFPDGAAGVVLVGARSFADGVVAAPLAVSMGGPVLLAERELRVAVADELVRLLEPGAPVTIVGGAAAVPDAVERSVRALGFEVTRVAGATRFHTAVEVARRLGSPPAVIADGLTFPDALVAGTAATKVGKALVLTAGTTLPRVTRDYLLEVGSGHVAVGGPAATAAPGAETVVGADRYDTAARVLAAFFGRPHVVGIASGHDFADAVSLAALLGSEGAPVLLTPSTTLAPGTAAQVGLHLLELYVAGGTAAVGTDVEHALTGLLTESGLFGLHASPDFVHHLIPGHRPLALVTASGSPTEAVRLTATASLGAVEVTPATIQPGEVAEVWVDVPEVTEEAPLSVTVTGVQGELVRTVTVDATATPGTDDLAATALDIADVFLDELQGEVVGLPGDRNGLSNGTPVAGLLVVSHYAWFTDELEIGLAWHVMVAPDDWAELYVRPRGQLVPSQAFRLSSWSTALSGGTFTVTEIPPPPTVTR